VINVVTRSGAETTRPLRSSGIGMPVSTPGGFVGAGGPFALQLGGRISF
jgi:hypothetical protein